MQKITVANVEIKAGKNDKGDWIKTSLTGADGLKASGFDKGLATLKAGDAIEAEIVVDGKYTNILSWKIISQGVALPEEKKETTPQKNCYRSPDQSLSIEGQVCLKEVGEFLRLDAPRAVEVLGQGIIDLYKKVIRDRLAAMLGELDRELAKTSKPATKTVTPETFPDFKTSSEFANWWMKNGFTWIEQQAALRIKALGDIKDFKAASEVLAKIKAARDSVSK